MSLFRLAWSNLAMSPLASAVNVLLLALGTASIAVLLLASAQLSSSLTRNAAGIDLVVGAKGSPLQLVLAGVYHADVPPGNIPLAELDRLQANPMVASAVPLSLGDSFNGFRIVGTTPAYPEIYGAEIQAGHYWDAPLQAVIGATVAEATGLDVGDEFEGVHGLAEDGDRHDEATYQVTGRFAPTGSVIDSLIVTSLDSVWQMHAGHGHASNAPTRSARAVDNTNEHDHEEDHHDEDDAHEDDEHEDHHHDGDDSHDEDHAHSDDDAHHDDEEDAHAGQHHHAGDDITLMLVQLSSPLGMLSLPREINEQTAMQAASPAYEVARLLQIVGIGLNWLNAFAAVLVVSAALSIFAALYASLRSRRHDLAVLRCLGGSRSELFYLLFVEGLVLTLAGIMTGLLFAHGGMELLSLWLGDSQGINVTGWTWAAGETILVAALLLTGALTAAIPAWQAYRTDVPQTLSAP